MKLWGLEWSALDSYFQFVEQSSAPGTPEANHVRLYAFDSSGTSTLCLKNDAGGVVCFPAAAGTLVTGTGVAGRVAFWDGVSSLSNDTDLTFSGDTLSATKVASSSLTSGRMTFASTLGLLIDDATLTYVADSSNSSIVTIGDNSHTGVFNSPAGLSFNIDSDNNDTGALFVVQTNTALRLSGGTRLFTINETGSFGVGSGVNYGSSGEILTSAGNAAAPTWSAPATQTSALLSATHTDTAASAVTRGDLVYGNSTPAWDDLAVGASSGMFLRTDATDVMWSTLILPNAITANQVVYGSATNTYGASADVTYDGTDFALGSGKRFRMQSQNRTRYLNMACRATRGTTDATGLAASASTAMLFDTHDFITDSAMHSTSSNTSRFIAPIAGIYLLGCNCAVDTTSNLLMDVKKNGTIVARVGVQIVAGAASTGGWVILSLAANDYVEFFVNNGDAVAHNIYGDNTQAGLTWGGMFYLGE